MSKSNSLENSILKLLFQAVAIPDLAENDTSSPKTALWFSLHTGTGPTEAGDQTTAEVATSAYGGYTRKSIARTATGFTVTNNSVSPAANLDFPSCTSGTATITYGGIGTASSGAGVLMYKGAITPSISVSAGVIPRLLTSSVITED